MLTFEHGVGFLERWLRKRGREGLAKAVSKVVLELTLLGFVSLILLLFQDYVPNICVKYSPSDVEWTLVDNVDGCPCCLQETEGVTTCAQIYHGCAFNQTNMAHFCGCDVGWPESTYEAPLATGSGCVAYDVSQDAFVLQEFSQTFVRLSESNQINGTELCHVITKEESLGAQGTGLRKLQRRYDVQSVIFPSSHGRRLASSEVKPSEEYLYPHIGSFRCQGPFYSGACANGSYPAVSDTALDQMHLMVFLMAGVHVVVAVIVVAVAQLRMQQWRRWQKLDIDSCAAMETVFSDDIERNSPGHSNQEKDEKVRGSHGEGSTTTDPPLPVDATMAKLEETQVGTCTYGGLESAPSTHDGTRTKHDVSRPNEISKGLNASTGTAASPEPLAADQNIKEIGAAVENDDGSDRLVEVILPQEMRVAGGQISSGILRACSTNENKGDMCAVSHKDEGMKAAKMMEMRWKYRDSMLRSRPQRVTEAFICFGQALLPNLVSRHEFSTMRRAYIRSLGLPHDFDFVNEATLHLDFDLSRIVGSSMIMWVILILQWLLSGLISWATSLLMLLCILTLLVINIWLVVSVRYCCRGGRPHRLGRGPRWQFSPRKLAIPIGGIIFMSSTVYSSFAFFAWQFGGNSCFFESGQQKMWRWIPGDLPWWTSFIGSGIMLLWLASVTVPAWALVTHMKPQTGKAFCVPAAKELKATKVESKEWTTQAEILAEIEKLQRVLNEMQL
jgi:hypothetical protein